MVKKKKVRTFKHAYNKRHHHVKLATLLLSKLIIALIGFSAGLYIGSLAKQPFVALVVAGVFAALLYLALVVHLVDWLKIEG